MDLNDLKEMLCWARMCTYQGDFKFLEPCLGEVSEETISKSRDETENPDDMRLLNIMLG